MTWIRWDTETPDSEVVAFLAERTGVKVMTALGHYNALCCAFGDHRRDGELEQVTDTALEHWARWDGKRGRFAAAIREWCAKGEAPGKLRGWWRNEAVLRKQEADAKRPDGRKGRGIPPKSPANPARDSRLDCGGNEHEHVDEHDTTAASLRSAAAAAGRDPAVLCAVAANTGLRANPDLPGFNELLPNQARKAVDGWLARGIVLEVITAAIEARCREFQPKHRGDQPNSFRYFEQVVTAAHEAWLTRQASPPAPAGAPALTLVRSPEEELQARADEELKRKARRAQA